MTATRQHGLQLVQLLLCPNCLLDSQEWLFTTPKMIPTTLCTRKFRMLVIYISHIVQRKESREKERSWRRTSLLGELLKRLRRKPLLSLRHLALTLRRGSLDLNCPAPSCHSMELRRRSTQEGTKNVVEMRGNKYKDLKESNTTPKKYKKWTDTKETKLIMTSNLQMTQES